MNKFAIIVAFGLGMVTGGIYAYIKTSKQYEEINNSNMEAMWKEVEHARMSVYDTRSDNEELNVDPREVTKEDVAEAHKKNATVNYAGFAKTQPVEENKPKEKLQEMDTHEAVEYIAGDEFGKNYDYDRDYLTYYKDGILVNDSDDKVITVPESILGSEWEHHIGEYADDTLYVRNDEFEVYYEVLISNRKYDDMDSPGDS